MVYRSKTMLLNSVRIVAQNDVNDIVICRDISVNAESYYTLLIVKDHELVKKLLVILEQKQQTGSESYIENFSYNGNFCMVFEYRQERPISEFYIGRSFSIQEAEQICVNMIVQCMASGLPYPLLYLILQQRLINIAKDQSISFSYELDLSGMDFKKKEKDCVAECAQILRELLEPHATQKAISYQLLGKKLKQNSYQKFTDLYKDVKIASAPQKKKTIFKKIYAFFERNRDRFFRVLLVLCIIALIIALVMLVSQIIFGDIPFLRLFFNPFKKIGTESLLQ